MGPFDSLTVVAGLTDAKIFYPHRVFHDKRHMTSQCMHIFTQQNGSKPTNLTEKKSRDANELEKWNELKIYLRMLHAPSES